MAEGQSDSDDEFAEAWDRRDRTLAIIRPEGVPYLDSLPLIEMEADIPRRGDEEVALRAMALAAVALRDLAPSQEAMENYIEQLDIEDSFTPKERVFIHDANSSRDDRMQFSWRCECLHVLLWALGFVETLGRPDHKCDSKALFDLVWELGREGLIEEAQLRPARELLDAADLLYCYHWAVRDAQMFRKPVPAGLSRDVVQEWHYAVNWLICYKGAEWDEVAVDT